MNAKSSPKNSKHFEASPEPLFAPAKRASLSQVVLDQIVSQIRDGRIKPGERLPTELELVRLFQVGRSSVREGLRGLITLGLIETRPGRGAVVAAGADSPLAQLQRSYDIEHLNKRSLLDLLEVREGLEGLAAEYAARRATTREVKELRLLKVAVEREVRQGRTYFRQNHAFHAAIARMSRNSVLAESIHLLAGQVRLYRERMMREIRMMPQRDLIQHAAIVEAIARGDAEAARRTMVSHIRSFAELVSTNGDDAVAMARGNAS